MRRFIRCLYHSGLCFAALALLVVIVVVAAIGGELAEELSGR